MKGLFPTAALIVVAIALLVSFGIDLNNTAHNGAVDMRNRITGIRLLTHGIDAYHYKWREGDPPQYCDLRNNNPYLPVSKTTVTPTVLMLQLPFAPLPYRLTQFSWLVIQWLLLLGIGWIWLHACPTPLARWLGALFLTGFTYTEAWRWEAERGQAYILFAFLSAYWLAAMLDSTRTCDFRAGCAAGFLIALRPPCILLLPFLALHRRGQLAGAAVGLCLGMGLPLLISPTVWTHYYSAMQTYSYLYRNNINPPHGPMIYPAMIEGIPTDLLGHLMWFHSTDFSVHGLLRWLGLEPFPELPLFLILGVPFAAWLWLSRRLPAERLLAGLAAWFFISDLFLPAIRYGYHDIFALNVVLAGIVLAGKFPWQAWPCVLALPAGWAINASWATTPWVIGLPAFLFTLGAILFVCSPSEKEATTSDCQIRGAA